jgi:hypothetical protein
MSGNPTDDLPSIDTEQCDIGGCEEPWAGEVPRRNGPRFLRLCEDHFDRWSRGEAALYAELEERAGRVPPRRPQPGTARALADVGHGMDKRRRARRTG